MAVHDQLALLEVVVDLALELAVHRVVLQHIGQVVYRAEVVDAYDLVLVSLRAGSTENHTADTTEAVDTNLNSCHNVLIYLLVKNSRRFSTRKSTHFLNFTQ